MSPGNESHSSYSVPLIPGDMSPGKACDSCSSESDSRVHPLLVLSVLIFTLGGLLGFSDSFRGFASCSFRLSGWLPEIVMLSAATSFVMYPGCNDGGGNGLTRAYLIIHLRDRHCSGEVQAITKNSLLTDLVVFERAEVTLKRMGIWLCGVCFKTHTLRDKCRHGADIVPPPDIGDGVVRFVIYDLTKPLAPSCSQLDHVDGLLLYQHDGFTLSLLDSFLLKGLRTVKSIPLKCRLGFSRVLKGALDKCKSANKRQRQEESIINAIRSWGVPGGSLQLVNDTLAESSPPMLDVDEGDLDLSEQNLKQCKRKICDGHYTAAVRVLSFSSVAPNNDATLQELKAKHSFTSAPSLPDIPIDHHLLIASHDVVLNRIKSFLRDTSCGHDGLRAQHLMDYLSGAAVAISDELVSSITQVPGGGIRPIVVGIVWRRLVSKVSATMIGHSLDGYLDGLQFGIWVQGGGEAILHAVNRLVEDRGDDVGLSMLLVDFQNAFYLVNRTVMLEEVRLRCPAISRWVEFCYSNPTRLYYGEHSMWSCQGVQQSDPLGPLLFFLVLHPPICKIRDSFNLCLRAWYLDDVTIVGDTLVVGKVLELITEDGLRCGLHLNVDKTELFWPKEDLRSRLEGVFPPNISLPLYGVKLLGGLISVDVDFSSALVTKRVSKTIGLLDTIAKINDPQCELLLIRACARISKLYFSMRTCPPRVFESAQLSFDMALRSTLERIVTASGPGFGDWKWRLRTLPFAFGGLGVYSAAFGSTFDDALCVFNSAMEIDFLSNPSRWPYGYLKGKSILRTGFVWFRSLDWDNERDVYRDHVVSCAGVIGIKHRHKAVRDTLVDICFRSGISAGKEFDIGLGGGRDKALRHADMLLYSWDGGLDVCVDLTGSSPLTQTGMADFVPGLVVLDAAQRKPGKYMTKCAAIGYGFLPFFFSSLGELEADAVTLRKRIRKFSVAQDIGARAAIHIFNGIGFSIAKGVGAPDRKDILVIAHEDPRIHQSPRGIFINQAKYAQEILKKYGMTSCDSIGTPMATKHLDAKLSGTPVDQTKYHSMVGALMYLTTSRPFIVHTTCYCARYQAKPTEKHLTAVKRIFRYLKDTINIGLWYPRDASFKLTAFSDLDHAGCLDSRKSTPGGIQFLGGDKLVSWSSKKQDCTSMSSAEAEYVSLSACCAQVLWLRTQLTDY
ncbi:putative reverse transcriptase domain-containing protein, partial [Tanacetum coccineum]